MRFAPPAALLTLLAFSLACHQGDTINIVNSDCGLVRSDLVGTWTFSFASGSTKLFNCSNASFNNKDVVIASGSTFSFNDMEVFASGSNVGFFFHNSSSPEQVFGNTETDSCGMLFAFQINASSTDPTPLYLQCVGTLDRHTRFVNASCDSATVLQAPLTDPVTVVGDCDLSLIIPATVSIQ
jgi:hypothetical protein